MSHVTHMNESCHTYEWVMSHVWTSHVTHMNESCHTFESCHTYESCHPYESCHAYESCHTHTHQQALRAGDLQESYRKGTHALSFLSLLAQASTATTFSPTAATFPSSSSPPSSSASSTENLGKYESKSAGEVAQLAAIARELGLYDEAVLLCRRALLGVKLCHVWKRVLWHL